MTLRLESQYFEFSCKPKVEIPPLLAQNAKFTATLFGKDGVLREVGEPPGMRHWHRSTFLLRLDRPFLFTVDGVLKSLCIFDSDLTALFSRTLTCAPPMASGSWISVPPGLWPAAVAQIKLNLELDLPSDSPASGIGFRLKKVLDSAGPDRLNDNGRISR